MHICFSCENMLVSIQYNKNPYLWVCLLGGGLHSRRRNLCNATGY